MGEALELFGYPIDIESTGEGGINAAKKNVYDTIFIDLGLPGLNGVECLLKIKQSNAGARCFLMTG